MSSKRAADPAAAQPGRRGLLARWSTATQVALLYPLSAVVLMATVVVVLHGVLADGLDEDDIHFLGDKVQQLRLVLRDHADEPAFLDQEVWAEGGVYAGDQHHIYYARILDGAGAELIATPGMGEILPARLFPVPTNTAADRRTASAWTDAGGRTYLLMAARAERGGRQPAARLIQVALDDTRDQVLVARYRLNAVVLVAIGTLLSAAIGLFVARRMLRPLRDLAEVAGRITVTHLDERVEAEQWPSELTALTGAFDAMLKRLQDSHGRLVQFSGDLAHELRTPVHILIGQTEVALGEELEPEQYRQILESNLEEFNRLARMVSGVLFLARAEDPQTRIARERLDARQELEAIRDFHEALAEHQGVSLICRGQADLYADPLLLRRALTNLVSNALRYTPRFGAIVLAVEVADDGATEVSVSDTGAGIPAEHLARIFDRLYRPDRTATPQGEGAGLGLAIVRSIVELHGGSAAVHSTVGAGTTVTLRFPAAPAS